MEPLYITVYKDGFEIHKVVLIDNDNRAGLNVCPLTTAKILGLDPI